MDMPILTWMTYLAIAIFGLFCWFFKPISDRLHIPYPLFIFVMGFLVTEVAVRHGVDTGLRFHNFSLLLNLLFLPFLFFNLLFNTDVHVMKTHWHQIIRLGIIGIIVSVALCASLIFYGVGHPTGFPWFAAILTAVILAGTSTHVIAELFHRIGVPENILVLLEGESIIADILAVIAFEAMIQSAMMRIGGYTNFKHVGMELFILVFGGVGFGAIVGAVLYLVADKCHHGVNFLLSLIAAWGVYQICYVMLPHGASVLAVASLAVVLNIKYEAHHFMYKAWGYINRYFSIGMYGAMGAVTTFYMFQSRYLAMIIAIVAIFVARFIASQIALLGESQMTKNMVAFGGLRSALPVALVFSLPTELPYWFTIQSIIFGVVVFGFVIQLPCLSIGFRHLKR